jgi:hypothetical protein
MDFSGKTKCCRVDIVGRMPGFQLRPAGVFPIGDRLKGQQNCQSSFEIARSSFYYRPRPESAEELDVLKRLDRIFRPSGLRQPPHFRAGSCSVILTASVLY